MRPANRTPSCHIKVREGRDGEAGADGDALVASGWARWRALVPRGGARWWRRCGVEKAFYGWEMDVLGWGGGETYCVWEGGARSKPERGLLKKGVDFEH